MDGANEYEKRTTEIDGVTVGLSSYRVGKRFSARIDNIDPGAIIGRGQGATRDEAEREAMESAALTLKLRDAARAMRQSAQRLPGRR